MRSGQLSDHQARGVCLSQCDIAPPRSHRRRPVGGEGVIVPLPGRHQSWEIKNLPREAPVRRPPSERELDGRSRGDNERPPAVMWEERHCHAASQVCVWGERVLRVCSHERLLD